jgi:hypothetical protein
VAHAPVGMGKRVSAPVISACGWESHSCFGETGYFVMEVLDGRMVQSLNRDEDQYDQYPTYITEMYNC